MALVSNQSNSRPADPTAPLKQAFQCFENLLTEEQKQQYHNTCRKPDASSALKLVCQIDANNKGRASRCVAPRLCTFLEATQQFAGVVDTFANSNPTVAALVWGSIKTTILTVSNIASYFDKVTSMIMNLGRSCPTYQRFGQLYPDCIDLQSALCGYYAIIIRLCMKIVKVSRRPGVVQVLSSIFNPFESEFKSYHDELEVSAKDVQLQILHASNKADQETARLLAHDRTVQTARWRSTVKFQKDSRNEHAEAEQWRIRNVARESVRMKSAIKANLSTINHVKAWKQAMKQRAPDTADWFQQDPAFCQWENANETAVLWVSGTLGMGKTVLVSNVVGHLHAVQKPSDIMSYFFCRWDHAESLRARSILGSVTCQLLDSRIEHAKDDLLSRLHDGSQDLSATDTIDFLNSYLEDGKTYYIIIDGLDECESGELREIAHAIRKLSTSRPKDLKILFAGRPELERALFSPFIPDYKMALTRKEVDSDIDRYIMTTLDEYLDDKRLILGDPLMILKIAAALRTGSHGMFLWTRMVIEEICLQPDDNSIIEALENLPRGLSDLLDRKLRRVTVGNSARQAIKILQFCGVAKRPLTVNELREALSVEPGQKSLNHAKLPNDMERILINCGGLTFVDEEENTVHFVHHTLKRHLFESQGSHSAEFVEADLDKHLGYICMTYLDFSDFKCQIAKVKQWSAAPLDPLKMGINAVRYESGRISRIAQKLLHQSLKAYSMTTGDFQRKAQELLGSTDASRLESELSSKEFYFFDYAKQYWIFHLKNIEHTNDEQVWKLFCRCIDGKHVKADRPWTICQQKRNLESQELANVPKELQWCLANKHNAFLLYTAKLDRGAITEDVLRAILDYAVTHDERRVVEIVAHYSSVHHETLSEALQTSAANGRFEIVSMLLAAGADVNAAASKPSDQTVLEVAAGGGNLDMVEKLLGAGANVNAPATMLGSRTALQAAAGGGHVGVIERLLAADADVNAPAAESYGRTALQAAAEEGHLNVVEMLLGAGADVNAPAAESYGQTAFQAAVRGGYLNVVERLLAAGANVNTPAAKSYNQTALLAAAKGGYIGMVERLLAAGADVNAPPTEFDGWTALQVAARGCYLDVLERLLGAGANVNIAAGFHNQTALRAAAEGGHLGVVERLLMAGADVNAPAAGPYSYTALQVAAGRGDLDMVERLIRAGADVNAPAAESYGHTALQAAAEGGHLAIVEKLLRVGADVNAPAAGPSAQTALQAAAEGDHLGVVELLLAAGADVNAPAAGPFGRTALQVAAEGGHLGVVEILLVAGSDVNAPAAKPYGRTALQAAAGEGHLNVVEKLLEVGADVNAPAAGPLGRTALQAATEGGHFDVAKRLQGPS